jgi:MoxR-like ATPase
MATSLPQGECEQTRASLNKLLEIKKILSHPQDGKFVGKANIVDMIIVCAIAQEPMVIFGEPGTAKSAIVSRFCDLLAFDQRDYFKYLLTSFTEPDELLGVVDIEAYMKEHDYRRFAKGSIQQAKIVFLDEVFRGNSAILNTLLSIINERVYYEGGEAKPAKTQVVYGATNDVPSSRDLRAFYARFPIRVLSNSVLAESESLALDLLEKGWQLEVDELYRRSLPPEERVTVNREQAISKSLDLERCQTWLRVYWSAENLYWSDRSSGLELIKRAYLEIIRQMNDATDQFQIDDRKAIKIFKLILAHAMLRGGPTGVPSLHDVWAVLQHTWEDPESDQLSKDTVCRVVSRVNNRYIIDYNLPEHLRFAPLEEGETR